MNSFTKKTILIAAAILALAATFSLGIVVGVKQYPAIEKITHVLNKQSDTSEQVDFALFWDVWHRLESNYVDKANLNRDKMVLGAIDGLTKSLGDPYTIFFPPVEAKRFQEDISGSFAGIGAEVGIKKGILTIIAPLKNSPAERAGLLAGDKVFKINATSTADLTIDTAVGFIRGPKGTEVTLTITRDSWESAKEIKIVRDTIVIPVTETKKLNNGIFYIHLFNFNETSPNEFRKALQEFSDSGSKKLILDLRNNPGGFLTASVDIASWFLPAGEIVAREKSIDSETDYRSFGYRYLESVPTVVLIDQGSASASEILAGALRDQRGAKLVGMKSFGKGSVQEVENLPGGASLKITIAKWFTPNNYSINESGLDPDVKVEVTQADIDAHKDPQLDKAVELLKTKN
ncbi:S41 family peptidase [Patescibacteria group bacterium]|nr:S41 family peptidase [Patescibacteria group bacterium]